LPLGLVVEFGAVSDKPHAMELLAQAQAISQPPWLYADAGYDAEKFHVQCREQWGVQSAIQPVYRRTDGQLGGRWRSLMTPAYLKEHHYGKRWAVESFFSGLKRMTGGALTARLPHQQVAEATFRFLAYVLRR
jgi:hypothetical protein